MKLYDNALAPNPRRVRIYLAEKGLEVPTVQVDLFKREQKSDTFKRKNSLGALPVLELDDGQCIAESVAICRYFEELHPQPALFGRDALERAHVEMWNRRIELGFGVPLLQVWIHGSPITAPLVAAEGGAQVPAAAEFNREVSARFFRWFDRELDGSEFIAGKSFSVADITALCMIDFAAALVGLTVDPALTNVARWHATVSTRPSAKA